MVLLNLVKIFLKYLVSNLFSSLLRPLDLLLEEYKKSEPQTSTKKLRLDLKKVLVENIPPGTTTADLKVNEKFSTSIICF